MIVNELFNSLELRFENSFNLLEDKPEETVYSSLKTLWFVAAGNPKSVSEAVYLPLPELTENQVELLYQLIEKRISNTPLAHISGRQRFMGIDFKCDARALIPRKETEILGEKALEVSLQFAQKNETVKIIDLCCGAGNLGLALASLNPKVQVAATDISNEAVALTIENIKLLNLEKRAVAKQGDLFGALENDEYYENTDLIVCNPPYISSGKIKNMNPEIIQQEPVLAFDGGMFGTKILQKLIADAPRFLKKGGWLLFEVGIGQGEFIMKICDRSNLYSHIESSIDGKGQIRTISVIKK